MDENSQRIVGETAEEFAVERADDLYEVQLSMLRQARRTVDLVSRHLDPRLYDTEDVVAAVKAVALSSSRAQIRLLILDPTPVVSQGHRLLALASRLSSFIHLRVPAPEHKEFNEAWLVVDNKAYAHRRFSDRYEAAVNFKDPRLASQLTNRFEELWQRGLHDPNLRRLHL